MNMIANLAYEDAIDAIRSRLCESPFQDLMRDRQILGRSDQEFHGLGVFHSLLLSYFLFNDLWIFLSLGVTEHVCVPLMTSFLYLPHLQLRHVCVPLIKLSCTCCITYICIPANALRVCPPALF